MASTGLFKCDRCNKKVESDKTYRPDGWGRIDIDRRRDDIDLCPTCVDAAVAWVGRGNGVAGEPQGHPYR